MSNKVFQKEGVTCPPSLGPTSDSRSTQLWPRIKGYSKPQKVGNRMKDK